MYKHVNVKNEKSVILDKMKESLSIFNENDELTFFNVVDFLGCYLSALFESHYSASDCCNTANTLEKLFQISDYNKVDISSVEELENILYLDGNYFYNFKLFPKSLPFHTFTVVKYDNNWFLLQSFSGTCYLFVNEDPLLPEYILNFLKDPTTDRFNQLFNSKVEEYVNIETKDVKITLYYTSFNTLPTQQLLNLIQNFIKYNS